jgi:hypothetical protein
MDLDGIIKELLAERNRLDQIIKAMEKPGEPNPGGKGPAVKAKGRRGRKFMNEQDRLEVSERMRRYWAARREKQTGEQSPEPAPGLPDAAPKVSPEGPTCAFIETGQAPLTRAMGA